MGFEIGVGKILADSKQLVVDSRFESDSISYFHFINFFKDKSQITENDFIVSAYFSYGWMPTILNLNFQEKKEIEEIVLLLNAVRSGYSLDRTELHKIKNLINNSIVGTSKLLHFINPSKYLIWDSRVANYFGIKLPNNVDLYLQYLSFCHKLDSSFVKEIHSNVALQINCMKDVTELRALEFVFFNKGLKKNEITKK